MSAGAVEVQEAGRSLKVHAHTPHLVSLGGGRLSTAVTLHPLPEGRTTIGCGQAVDVAVQGTGVEAVHCHIDNHQGTVTLVPVAEMISVDNVKVAQPTRLSQGCTLCVGRSNYLRFNHPAEATLMKSVLPNPRISMHPYGLYSEESSSVGGKPPPGPRGSWDSWEGLSSASSEEIARYISPKVFPAGSSTVNSPAAVVLGHRVSHVKLSLPPLVLNGENEIRPNSGNVYQNVYALPNGQYAPRVESPPKGILRVHSPSPPPQSPRYFKIPSPAFDRNPTYQYRGSVTSPTQSWSFSVEDLTVKKGGEAEIRRRQAENERLNEQETEKLERQRLDEILMMCADYEKQAQWERMNKPQQNRIITNGSLPRDKRLPSPNSPHFNKSFTYESPVTSPDCNSKNVDCLKPEPSIHPPSSPRTRIRTIAAKDSAQCYTSPHHSLEFLENRLAILNDYEILGPPPPPRNSSRNVISPEPKVNCHTPTSPADTPNSNCSSTFSFDAPNKFGENNNNTYKSYPIAEANALSKYEFFGFNPREDKSTSYQHFKKSTESLTSDSSRHRDSFQSMSTQNSTTKSVTKLETDPSWTSADFMVHNDRNDTIKRNGEYTTEQLLSQLDVVLESIKTCSDSPDREKMTPSPRSSERDSGIAEPAARDSGIVESGDTPLPDSLVQAEIVTSLRMERNQLVANLTSLKAKAVEIEQQEEELMRELEIERALVSGELQAQQDKLVSEDRKVAELKERVAECEREMNECVTIQAERQAQARKRLDQQQALLNKIEQQLMKCPEESDLRPDLLEACKQQQEVVENERKSFEDLEFSQLEEEAGWLSRREELQREVSESLTRCKERRERLASLQAQRDQAVRAASASSRQLTTTLNELLLRIDQGKKRLKEIDTHLQNPTKPFKMEQEVEKKQSQDDIERISRVTSGAPIEMSSNSLGRRTIASLQEIERNRQLHLAKQGSQVIEEERQRVSELKRRVQNEARAEYQRRLRDNCQSEESIFSRLDSPLTSTSSDNADNRLSSEPNKTEETESEDRNVVVENRHHEDHREHELPHHHHHNHHNHQHHEQEVKRTTASGSDSRPQSESSMYSEDLLSVRMRGNNSTNIQRPLTRYLPIRDEELDLRQHIETAGHQIDLCPHVTIDKTSCRGFLHKMTSRFHKWHKRWFVFDRSHRTLTYYSDRNERKPHGGAYFQAIEEVYVDHSNAVKSPNPAITFAIKSSERTYHLLAPSPEAMRIWVDVIFTGAEGYREFAHGS